MKENNVKLYSKDAKGKIRIWEIWSFENKINIEHGLLNGVRTKEEETVSLGLASRTLEEQIISRISSRVNKKKDAGYVDSLDDAINNKKTNALGFLKPAKCSRYDKVKDEIPYDTTYIQTKLDGHHCNITNDHGTNVAYSSGGKIIDTIPEILNNIKIPVGRTVEGELYHHGTILQTISSWVKKRQENTKKLSFHMYDIDSGDCYSERLKELEGIKHGEKSLLHHTDVVLGNFNISEAMKISLSDGYEGLVLRLLGFPHEDGKRSKGLVKVKPMHFGEFKIDDEFLVVDIKSSPIGAVLQCVCNNENGTLFGVTAPGTMKEKMYVLENKKLFIGKHVRVEYGGFTKNKIPFHPVATMWREKFDE